MTLPNKKKQILYRQKITKSLQTKMFTSFSSKSKTTSIKKRKGKLCPKCGTQQPCNVVKICKNKKCQHVFVFKCKKEKDGRGCTTKTCPECGKHAKGQRSGDCSDPACGYKFPSCHKTKKEKKKPKKSKKIKAKIGHKRKNTVRVSKPFDLIENDSGITPELYRMAPKNELTLESFGTPQSNELTIDWLFGSPPLNERNSSIDLFGTPPLNERNSSIDLFGTHQYKEPQDWNGYMQDTIDDVVSSEDNEDWVQAIRNQI